MDALHLRKIVSYNEATGEFINLNSDAIAGNLNGNGYVYIKISGKSYRAHRLAWLYVNGSLPSNPIDHINGIRHDNRIANLRECTNAENSHNQRRPQGTNPYIGVSFHKRSGLWQASIKKDKKQMHLGYFKNPEDARDAYIRAKQLLHPSAPHRSDI